MKSIKLMFFLFWIFTIKTFSQNPIIEDISFCSGSSISQSISVKNPSITATYTWQVKTPTVDWITITNANAGVLYKDFTTSILNITRSNSLPITLTKYRVIANISSLNFISNESLLTVNPILIAKTISGATPVCIGGDKTLTYGLGSIGDIQWQYSTTSATLDFNDIDLENGLTYQAKNLQETTWFRVMNISGGCNPVFSPAVQVTVNTLSEGGDIEGGDIDVCVNSNSTELILYNYEGSIVWQRASSIDGPFTNINFTTSSTYRANSLLTKTYFRTIVTSGVCPSATSIPIYINVNPASVAKSITGSKPVCIGGDITLTYGTGSVGDIQWQYSNTSSNSVDFIDIDNSNGFVYDEKDLQETTWYRVMNTSGDCIPVYSSVVQVVVDPLAEYSSIDGGDINVCKTSNTTLLNINDSEGSIQWQKATEVSGSPATFTNIPNAIRKSFTTSALTETTYFRGVITSGVCPTLTTENIKIIVDTPPVVKSISGASPMCLGGKKVLVYGSNSFGDIQWQYSTISGSSGFLDIPAEDTEIYLAEDLEETTWFRVSNTSGECSPEYSPIVRVDVNPLPVSGFIEGGNTIVSKNSNSTELILKNYKGAIQWQKSDSLTGTFIDIPISTSNTFKVTGITNTSYYRAIVSNDCSKVISEPVVINVKSDFKVSMYPNPFKEEFNFDLISLNPEPIELNVYDLLGKKIECLQIESKEINSKRFGLSYLPGFYSISIKQGEQEKVLKVLKQ